MLIIRTLERMENVKLLSDIDSSYHRHVDRYRGLVLTTVIITQTKYPSVWLGSFIPDYFD